MAWFNPSTWSPVDALQGQHPESSKNSGFVNGSAGGGGGGGGAAPYLASAPAPTATYAAPVSGGGGGGGGAAPAAQPPDLSAYDQSINNLQAGYNRLDNQTNIGHQNIMDSYQTAYNTLLGQKNQANQQYTQNKNTEGQSYVTNKNQIGAGVGNAVNAAQKLLGSRGAGGSSAALFNAPQAAGRQGSLQRNAAGQTYSQNNQALDQGWGDFQNNWNNSATDLAHQKDNQLNGLDAQIAQNRANLLQNIAQIQTQRGAAAGMTTAEAVAAGQPYLDQANQSLSRSDQLGQQYANPVLQTAAATYTAPDLATYTAAEHGPTTLGQQSGLTDSVSPYINLLLGKNRQQLNPLGV